MTQSAKKYPILLKTVCALYVSDWASEAEMLMAERLLPPEKKEQIPDVKDRMAYIARKNRRDENVLPFIEVYEAFNALDDYYRADGMNECFQRSDPLYEEAFCALEKMTKIKKYLTADETEHLEKDFKNLKMTLKQELPPRLRKCKAEGKKATEIGHGPLEKAFKASARAFKYKKMSEQEKNEAFKKIRNMAYVMYNVMAKKLEDPELWYGEKVLCMEQMIAAVNWLDWKRSDKFKRKQEIYHNLAELHKKHKCFAEAGRAEIMEKRFAGSLDNMVAYTVKKKSRYEKFFER